MKDRITSLFFLSAGLSSILIGLPYVYRLFGPQESDVGAWGSLSIYTGLILTTLTVFAVSRGKQRITKFSLGLFSVFTALIQIPPIAAWILFHGHLSLTDTPLQGAFKVHWGFAVPHIMVFLLCIFALVRLFRERKGICIHKS